MYRALKNTQLEITETLMKFADEIGKAVEPRAEQGTGTSSLEKVIEKQDNQFKVLLEVLSHVNSNLEKVLDLALSSQAVSSQTVSSQTVNSQGTLNITNTIPSVQPVSNPIDMVPATKLVTVQSPPYPLKDVVGLEVEVEEEV
jgi:hypothetical protein